MNGFRHVVLFTFAEGTTTRQKAEVAERLSQLPDRIPQIRSYSVGFDAGINPGNHQFAVVAEFADRRAYEVYRDHPEHRAVIDELITPILADRAAVQYEL